MRMFSVLQLIYLVFVSGGQAKTLGADVEVDDMILDQEQMDWLKSGLLHGELDGLIVNENTPKAPAISANALRDPNKLWPNKIVYYSFDATLTPSEQNTVRTTLSGLQDKLSCLTFQEKNDGNRIIVGTSGVGCWSEVGYKAKPQYLNLASGCWGTGTIEHEFLHAIGIYHHQSRSDRDTHVNIITNNIIDDKKHNFNKYDQTRIFHHGLPYDYGSVMHYGKSDFAKIPGDITIETLDPTKQDVIGNRDGVTSGDIELVRRAYGCYNSFKDLDDVIAEMSRMKSQMLELITKTENHDNLHTQQSIEMSGMKNEIQNHNNLLSQQSTEMCGVKSKVMMLTSAIYTINSQASVCSGYTTLSDSWRNIDYVNRGEFPVHCDYTGSESKFTNLGWGSWYRFTGAAGTKLPTAPAPVGGPPDYGGKQICATHAVAYITSGDNPTIQDGIVTRDVCFEWQSHSCAYGKTTVGVAACRDIHGDYFVYQLHPVPGCDLAYCAID